MGLWERLRQADIRNREWRAAMPPWRRGLVEGAPYFAGYVVGVIFAAWYIFG